MGNEVSGKAKSDEENQAKGSLALSTSIDGSTHDDFVFSTPNETPSASAQPSPAGSARASPLNLRDQPGGTWNHVLGADENEGSPQENRLDTSLRFKSDAASDDDILSTVLVPPEVQRPVTIADDSKNSVDCPPQSPLQKFVNRVAGEQSSPLPTRVAIVREEDLLPESSNDTLERLPQSPFHLLNGLDERRTSPLPTCLPTVQQKDLPAKDSNDTEDIPPQSPLQVLDRVTGKQSSPLCISVSTVREDDLRAEDSNDTVERPPQSPLHIIFDRDAGDQLSGLQKDTLIRPPQSALQTTYDRDAQSSSWYTSVPTVPEEDHAWMDPVLAAAAAGAASKKSRQEVQCFGLDRMIRMPFGFDDDLRESFQRLASTTRDTASTFAHMAVPAWIEAADTVKKSAKEIGESFQTRNYDTEKGQVTVGNDKQGTEHVKDAHKQGINQFVDDDWGESLKRLASTTGSAAATFAQLAAPALSEAADVVKKSLIEAGDSKTEPKENIDVQPKPSSANDGWETSLEQLTKTTQSAAGKLMWCCDDNALKISASEVAESEEIEISIRSDDGAQSALLDCEREALTIDAMDDEHDEAATAANTHLEQKIDHLFEQDGAHPAVMDRENEAVTGNTVFDDEPNPPEMERNAHSEQGADHVTDDDWRESLERLASSTKSATAEFANIAAPLLIEAADMVKKSVAKDARHIEENMESMEVKSTDELQESLQRLASSVKSTASSFITIASPIVTENANILINSAKEAAEEYKVSRQERNDSQEANGPTETSQTALPIAAGEPNQTGDTRNGGENEGDIDLSHSKNEETIKAKLDISNDESVIASPGWHNKNTPLRKHGSAQPNCSASAVHTNVDPTMTTGGDSPDSSLSPRPLATTKSIASQTPPTSLESMRKHDQDECVSVASLSITSSQSVVSSQHRLHSEKTKSLLSSSGNFMEMVSKKLASDSSRYPPTHRSGRNASQRTSRGACRTGNITPSPGLTPNRFSFALEQGSFEERQPVSPPDSLQQCGSLLANTPPRLQPPEEVTLWDMFPANDLATISHGGQRSTVLVEPQPRVLLENASDRSKAEIRSGSTYSSEDHQSLPMSTGFIGKRKTPDAYSNDAASDPGTTPFKRRRKCRRSLQVILRSSRKSDIPPFTLSPESSFLGESLSMDIHPIEDELSPDRQRDSASFHFDTLEGVEYANVAGLPGRQDKMLDQALLAFSSVNDVDILSKKSPQKIPESLLWLASVRWRQLIANWEHDEMMKAISARPCSLHCFDEPNQSDEHVHEWSGETWTTSVFHSKRDGRLTLRDEFRSSRRTSPSMTNHSGFRPLVCEGELQCLTSFVAGIGSPHDSLNAHQTVLRHTLAFSKDAALEDLLQSANTKLVFYTGVVKGIATFATINLDPANPKTAVHHSVDVKAAAAITQKAHRKYEGDILQVKDILRGQIILPDEGSLVCALSSLNSMCAGGPGTSEEDTNECIPEIRIVRVKNLFQFRPAKTPLNDNLPTGYRHVLVTIRFSDGFLAELQLQLSQMFQILGVGGYELHRQITQMDEACTYTEAPDFEQCTYGRSLKNILQRMFRSKSLIPNSVAEAKSVPEHIRLSPDNLGQSTTTNSPLPIDSKRESAVIGGSIMEPAAEANNEVSAPPPFLTGGGIAVLAAQAARNRNEASEKESATVGGDDSTADGANPSNEVSGPPQFLAGGGIAAMAALAARNRNKVFENESAAISGEASSAIGADANNEVSAPPPFLTGGGIAVLAAQAARDRNEASEKESATVGGDDSTADGANPSNEVSGPPQFLAGGCIAAMAALAARNRNKVFENESAAISGEASSAIGADASNEMSGPHPSLALGGIAAMAALAARNRNEASEKESVTLSGDDSTAAGAYTSKEVGGLHPSLAGGGIAAMAALAARNRHKASENESAAISGEASTAIGADASSDMSGPHPSLALGGIAAMAALAARNRNKASEKESVTISGDDSTTAGAYASNEVGGPQPSLAEGGIAAMAALAARNRNKESENESAAISGEASTAVGADASSDMSGPHPSLALGGIAAMAALAARNRSKAFENESAAVSGEASMAIIGAEESAVIGGDDRTEHGAYASNEVSGLQPSLTGGGIGEMAALVARNRSKVSEGKSASEDGDDKWEAGFDENDGAGGHAPLSGGNGLACAAALAARRRNKASEVEPTAIVRDDSTAAGADASNEASQRPRFGGGGGKPAQHRNDALEIESAAKGGEGKMKPDGGASHAAPSCGCEGITTADSIREKSSEGEWAKNRDVGSDPASQPPVHCVLPLEIQKHSKEDVLQLLILEALKDASCSSRRISTLCCASWLFYGVAFGTRNPSASDQNSHKTGGAHKFTSNLTCDVKPGELTAIAGGSGAAVDNAKENEMVSDGCVMAASSPSHEGEKKATIEDEKQQSLAAAFVRSGVTKNSDNEKESGVINRTAAAVAHQQNEKQREMSPDISDSQEGAHDISARVGSNTSGVIRSDGRYVVFRPESSEILPPIDLQALLRVGDRALLRALTIANEAVSHGMIGWLEYGSSNFRTTARPLDILGKLAYHHAMRGDWQASISVLRALVLQCEHHLPLYHPLTLSSMLDLAAALTKTSKHKTARHVLGQATDRLSFYLAEQEGAYLEFRDELQSGSNQNVTFQELSGANYVSMLRVFTSLFEELIDRDFLQLLGSDNDITLINHCLLGDSLSVLANCLRLSETGMDARKNLSASLTSNAYWSAACQHYRLAFEGWTRKGCGLTHPNVSAVACAIARCLREVGKVDRSIQILSSVVGATSRVSSSYPEAPQTLGGRSKDPSDDSLPMISFLPSMAGSFSLHVRARSSIAIEQSTALNLWYMAAYAVQSSQDERGRIRALSLLHASSQALQRALMESKSSDYAACLEEMLQCVEAEALELFKPLGAIKEERPRERKVAVAAIESAKNHSYKPTRTSMPTGQKPSTHACTTNLSVDDKTPHNHDGRYPQRRFRPRPKTSSVHSALV